MPNPIRILLVDDDPNYGALIERALSLEFPGVQIHCAAAEEAFHLALEQGDFNLVITECRLPWTTGPSVLHLIRSRRPGWPVLMITAAANERDAIEALGGGMDNYVLKTAGFGLRLQVAVATCLRRVESQVKAARTEKRLGNLLTRLNVGVFRSTGSGKILEANPAFLTLLGLASLAEAQEWGMDKLYAHPEDRIRLLHGMRDHGSVRGVEVELRHSDGHIVWVLMTKTLGSSFNGEVTFDGLVEDISERKLAAEALRESEARYALAANGTIDGLWDWNVTTGEVFYSPRFSAMLGLNPEDLGQDLEGWLARVIPEDRSRLGEALHGHAEGSPAELELEYRIRHADGTVLWMLCRAAAVRGSDGRATRVTGAQRDITERKEGDELLRHDTFYDGLTGLPNRAFFMEKLRGASEKQGSDTPQAFALLVIDVDRFQFVNDSLGHVIGDQLIIALAHRLKSCLRPEDTLARLGGDEFAILLEDVKAPTDAARIADRIHLDLERPFELCGHEIFATASIGIAPSTADADSPEVMLRDADTAMHRAKTKGRARHEVFHSSMHTHAVELLKLEGDLRRALERQEFLIYFQPIVALENWKIAGFEALLRWQHPERGLVLPEEFIPLAEDTGLIIPIAKWVLLEACRQTSVWQAAYPGDPPVSVSVNLSSRNLAHPDLIEQVDRALAESGLSGASLGLEITESALIENSEHALSVLARLRALNIRLQIDDFGTGYSSLSYLQQFPIDTLKIDRSFTTRMPGDGQSAEIVRTIMSLARNLNLSVVAEGVETREQAESLLDLHCELAQGFFFHPPLHPDQVNALLRAKARTHLV